MKITGFKTFVVGNPPPHFGGRYFIFLKLTTDDGIEGVGEAYAANFGPHAVARMIEDICERHVVGADPFRIEFLWRRIYGAGYSQRPDPSVMAAVSAIEMACWDILGKALGQPVYNLLGGRVHEKLRSYTYLYPREGEGWDFYDDPYRSAEAAAQCVAEGFTGVKFDPVGSYSIYDGRQLDLPSLARSELFCKLIREAVGDKADLLFGTHGQGTAAGAIRLAKRIEAYDPLWLEEPTPPERPEEMARVARQTSIPIATGERLATKWEFARVIELQAAAIIQMNLGRCGGLLEAKKIAGMAETRYVQIAPHLYCGPVVAAANIQLAACSPNFLILESIRDFGGFHAELLKTPLRWEAGYVLPPETPGLGVELNEEVALAHPYDDQALHLDMKPYPLSTYDDGNV